MKIRSVGAVSLRVDGRTDVAKLIVAVCSFSNAPNNVPKITVNGLEPSAPPAEQSSADIHTVHTSTRMCRGRARR